MKEKFAYHFWRDRMSDKTQTFKDGAYVKLTDRLPSYLNFRGTAYGLSFDTDSACIRRAGIMDAVSAEEALVEKSEATETLSKAWSELIIKQDGCEKRFVGFYNVLNPKMAPTLRTRVIRSGRYVQSLDISYQQFENFDGNVRLQIDAMPEHFAMHYDFNVAQDTVADLEFRIRPGEDVVLKDTFIANGVTAYTVEDKNGNSFSFAPTADPEGHYAELSFEDGALIFRIANAKMSACESQAVRTDGGIGLVCVPGSVKASDMHQFICPITDKIKAYGFEPEEYKLTPVYNSRRGIYEFTLCPQKNEWFMLDESRAPKPMLERVRFSLENDRQYDIEPIVVFTRKYNCKNVGVVPILREIDGTPTGKPMQISKNWHNEPEPQYLEKHWSDAYVPIELKAGTKVEYEYTCAYDTWGKASPASHAQLCLIGYGGPKGQWEQCAVGSFGENICYSPDLDSCSFIADIRLYQCDGVKGKVVWDEENQRKAYPDGRPGTGITKYAWTENLGGGEFLVYHDKNDVNHRLKRVKTYFRDCGPNLTRTMYNGITLDDAIEATYDVRLQRCDDVTRLFYRVNYKALKDVEFSRFAVFSIGADHYNESQTNLYCVGSTSVEYDTEPEFVYQCNAKNEQKIPKYVLRDHAIPKDAWIYCGGDPYPAMIQVGRMNGGAMGDKAFIIRDWKATVGGVDKAPAISIIDKKAHYFNTLANHLEVGVADVDGFIPQGSEISAVFEWAILPRSAWEFYGPNEMLRAELAKNAATWKMAQYEARGNNIIPNVTVGTLTDLYPAQIKVDNGKAEFSLNAGHGFVTVTFVGVGSNRGVVEEFKNGKWVSISEYQEEFGNDFWQAHYDEQTDSYELTYNLYVNSDEGEKKFRFAEV